MAELIPAINAASEAEFRERAALLRTLGPHWVQVDVSDGIVGVPKNYADPRVAAEMLQGFNVDVHLMVQNVPSFVAAWKALAPTRITVHVEALPDPTMLCRELAAATIECGLALAPTTPVERVFPYLETLDVVLLVAVPPGKSGQSFDPHTTSRVRELRARAPRLAIGIDGGVKAEHLPVLKAAGATVVCVASAVFGAPDPGASYAELKKLAA